MSNDYNNPITLKDGEELKSLNNDGQLINTTGNSVSLEKCLAIASDYHVTGNPDWSTMADLSMRARGNESLRTFAEKIGTSAATISRIENKKAKKALSHEFLAKIAANANPNSGVKIEMLLHANGEEKNRSLHFNEMEPIRQAIINGLLCRGYSVKEKPSHSVGFIFKSHVDLMLETSALNEGEEQSGEWIFDFIYAHPTDRYIQLVRHEMEITMGLYYCGDITATRVSIVVNLKDVYEYAQKIMEKLCIPNEISVILIENGEVSKEYVAPTTSGHPKEVFYELPLQDGNAEVMDEMNVSDWEMDTFETDDD